VYIRGNDVVLTCTYGKIPVVVVD